MKAVIFRACGILLCVEMEHQRKMVGDVSVAMVDPLPEICQGTPPPSPITNTTTAHHLLFHPSSSYPGGEGVVHGAEIQHHKPAWF